MTPSDAALAEVRGRGDGARPPAKPRDARLRQGKWTPEEEAYAVAVMRDFNAGYLDCAAGTSLRTYLSEQLSCDPMRITKKFTGDARVGKKFFHPATRGDPESMTKSRKCQERIEQLHQRWHRRLASTEAAAARQSMAETAVAEAAAFRLPPTAAARLRLGAPATPPAPGTHAAAVPASKARSDMIRTAAWLDQADARLDPKKTASAGDRKRREMEEEMREISRLIAEAPGILVMSADLPTFLDNA